MVDWTNTNQWSNRGQKTPRVSDKVEMVNFPPNEYIALRMIGQAVPVAMHWFTAAKKAGGTSTFPKMCLGLIATDPDHPTIDKSKCPYCQGGAGDPTIDYYQNVIVRDIQEDGPPRKDGRPKNSEKKPYTFNTDKAYWLSGKDSTMWTPVRMFQVNRTIGKDISEITGLNKHRDEDGVKQVFPPSHKQYGFDLMVKHDPDEKKKSDAYAVQKGELSELSKEEIRYYRWKLEFSEDEMEDYERAESEMRGLRKRMVKRNNGEPIFPEEFDPEGTGGKKSKGEGGKSKKKNRYRDEDLEDEVDDEDLEEEDEDEDDEPRRRSKSKKAASKKSRRSRDDDDDDDDDDMDEDDEDEDDEPPRRSKKSSSKKRSSRYEEEDEDDDDDDEDYTPRRAKGKKASSKKRRSRDDDDDDDDDDDEIPF